jgi:hypothetical protein
MRVDKNVGQDVDDGNMPSESRAGGRERGAAIYRRGA